MLLEGEVQLQGEGEGDMTTKITGMKTVTTPEISTQSMTQTGDNIEVMRMNPGLQELEGAQDQSATLEEIGRESQATIPEGKSLEMAEIKEMIGIEMTAIDKMDIGQTEAPAGKEVEVIVLKGLATMAMGGTHEKSAKRFQTWGNLW